jgi:hypothetical protein
MLESDASWGSVFDLKFRLEGMKNESQRNVGGRNWVGERRNHIGHFARLLRR